MEDTHHGHAHQHGGRAHAHASVDHLANEQSLGARLIIKLDSELMTALGVGAGDTVRVATDRGRSLIARLGEPNAADAGHKIIRLDRFARQALKAHLNEDIEIEPVSLQPLKKLELLPAVDVSMAHDLVPHLKRVLVESRTPASQGAVLYIPFANSHAGTTYEVHKTPDGPGLVTEATEVVLHYHDSHIPEGAFDITYEDVGGLGAQIKLIRELVQLPLKHPHVYRHLGINAPRGIILYGPPGSGKTHLARALGYAACQKGLSALFVTAAEMVNHLSHAQKAFNLESELNKYRRPQVLIIDELGYVQLDAQASNLFFQVISARHDQGLGTIATKNLPFGKFNQIFANDAIAHAIVDRLVNEADVFFMEGASYREHQRELKQKIRMK